MRLWLVLSLLLMSCRLPHEIPGGYNVPMRLTTICHVWEPEVCTEAGHEPGCRRTMMFNHPMAERHLSKHKADYLGECQ